MRISIFGAGYVGIVSAAALLHDRHTIVMVEPNESKVKDLDRGQSPVSEPGVAELLRVGHAEGRLSAVLDPLSGVKGCDMIWICVGTPSRPDGGLDSLAVETVIRQIGEVLRVVRDRPLVVVRSTVLPGTTLRKLRPILEQSSGLTVGREVHLAFHPEFLREGSALEDFQAPSKSVFGTDDHGGAALLEAVYEGYPGTRFVVTTGEAELAKYADNLFHAVKITFANELGAVARAHGLDARRVADVLIADTKLNISPAYLRPGFAFGGSCLPKDTRAMLRRAATMSLDLPLLGSVLRSNEVQIERLVSEILSLAPERVGMVGVAFKPNTDDLRESPYVAVAKQLIGEGIEVRIFDPGVDPKNLIGSNKAAAKAALRHLEDLLIPSLDRLSECDLVLINHGVVNSRVIHRWVENGTTVVALVDIDGVDASPEGYRGIAW